MVAPLSAWVWLAPVPSWVPAAFPGEVGSCPASPAPHCLQPPRSWGMLGDARSGSCLQVAEVSGDVPAPRVGCPPHGAMAGKGQVRPSPADAVAAASRWGLAGESFSAGRARGLGRSPGAGAGRAVLSPWLYGHQCKLTLCPNLSLEKAGVRLLGLWKAGGSPGRGSFSPAQGCPLAES